jgi:hypothetical protein
LVGDPRAGRVDQPEDRQLLDQRPLGDPDDLLDRPGTPRPGFDRRIIRHHQGRAAVDQSLAGYHTVGRQPWRAGVGQLGIFDEAAVVEEQLDPVADVELVRRG